MPIEHRVGSRPLNVLFLCTQNSSRSQIAEAIMTRKAERIAPGRFQVASAGASPAAFVNPGALAALRDYGIDWSGRRPKSIDSVCDAQWDLIITVCDRAKETCPTMPGQPAYAHWGMDDPAQVFDERARERAFAETVTYLARRIDLLLALPVETLERRALEVRVQQIADEAPIPPERSPDAGRHAIRTDLGHSRQPAGAGRGVDRHRHGTGGRDLPPR